MKRPVHIVLASDNYYFPYIYVAIKSLFRSNTSINNLYVHYIEQDVNQENLKALLDLGEEFERKIDIIKFYIPEEFDSILPAYGSASKTTYAKFWFASMFPNEDRILYLDPDVIVMDSIEDMYNTELGNNLVAGVIENLPLYHMSASLLSKEDSYINGGMVLCNLEAWRTCDFEQKAMERLKDTTHNLNYDQGILNELCRARVKLLPPRYNALAETFEFKSANKIMRRYGFTHYYSQKEIDEAINNPAIIHFTGFLYGKPLSINCDHPYSAYFQEILSECPIQFTLNNNEIDLKKKIRKFFLRRMPFGLYLKIESLLDIRRKNKL